MGYRVIQQEILAGNDFNGALPTTTPTRGHDFEKKFPADTVGGLFEFDLKDPEKISNIQLILGGQSAWTLSLVDDDGDELVIWKGTTETNFCTLESDRIPIIEKQTLKLVTTGATADLKARVMLET